MKYDVVFAGVGGQGVLSMAALIGRAAVLEGLSVKQSEVHGMAQRGGAVHAHLRLANAPIESDLVAAGTASLVLSLEPVEALRHLGSLAPGGVLVTASSALVNIPDYPDLDQVLRRIHELPHALVVDAERLAQEAGDLQTINTVMVGAVTRLLPLRPESLENALELTFAGRGEEVMRMNRAAFAAGRRATA